MPQTSSISAVFSGSASMPGRPSSCRSSTAIGSRMRWRRMARYLRLMSSPRSPENMKMRTQSRVSAAFAYST